MREMIKFLIWVLFHVIDFAILGEFGFVKKHRPKDKNNGANSEENRKTVEKP